MKPHPYADLFPMMTVIELDALAADIAEQGLRHPIVRYEGMVLDGRNRLAACKKAGVEPTFTDYEGGDPLGCVISLNVQRRDLTAAQRAIVAARALPVFEKQAKERMAAGGKKKGMPEQGRASREDAASVFKVGKNAVQQAKALLSEAPDLAEQVEGCALSLQAAYEQLQQRREQNKQKARDAARVAELSDAISNGEVTLEGALQQVMEQEREEREKTAAQADARRRWLTSLVEFVKWTETFVGKYGDDYLAWYTEPNSPGMIEHGLTAERIESVIQQFKRIKATSFGESDVTTSRTK